MSEKPESSLLSSRRPSDVAAWLAEVTGPSRSLRTRRLVRVVFNLIGALGAAYFLRASWNHYDSTRSWVGAGFLFNETWVVLAFLVRRPANDVSQRLRDWLLAFGGTFGGVLFRPSGAHLHWGVIIGADLQIVGLVLCVSSFLSLGRSFGFAPAHRGLKRRGMYRVVRHPIYASYILLLSGYLLQSLSVANGLVVVLVLSCNAGRALSEERLLSTQEPYRSYCAAVRWRMIPGLW